MTPDAKYYAYSCQQYLTTLYLVENLEPWRRPTFWSPARPHSIGREAIPEHSAEGLEIVHARRRDGGGARVD
jgi:hypothetical protein